MAVHNDVRPVSRQETVDLGAVRAAALTAAAVDRVFLAAMAAARGSGGRDLVARYGGPEAIGVLIDLRTALAHPGRFVTRAQVGAVTGDPAAGWTAVEAQCAADLVEIVDDRFRATVHGLDFLRELYRLHAEVTGLRWRAHGERVARLVHVTGQLVDAAANAPGASGAGGAGAGGAGAFAATAPVHEPAGTPLGVLLLNRLGVLRYHRADAHAAACRAAGLTVTRDRELPASHRDAVEAETDRLASAPFRAVTPEHRLLLLADLAVLP